MWPVLGPSLAASCYLQPMEDRGQVNWLSSNDLKKLGKKCLFPALQAVIWWKVSVNTASYVFPSFSQAENCADVFSTWTGWASLGCFFSLLHSLSLYILISPLLLCWPSSLLPSLTLYFPNPYSHLCWLSQSLLYSLSLYVLLSDSLLG